MSVQRRYLTEQDCEVSQYIAGFWRQTAWQFNDSELQAYIENLLDIGVTTMDHGFVYQSEAQFGRVLKNAPSLRDRMEIIGKFGIRPIDYGDLGAHTINHYDNSADYLQQSVERSLTDLNVDHLDILLVHRPDYLMHAQSLAEGFARLKDQGKVRHFGVSNFSPSQFELLQSCCDMPLVTNQIEFSPLCLNPLNDGTLDQCQQIGMNPSYWSCLGGGRMLTGTHERDVRVRNSLRIVADELGAESLEQVIYAWVMRVPCGGLPILGSSNIERIKKAIGQAPVLINREQWYAILEASTGARVL